MNLTNWLRTGAVLSLALSLVPAMSGCAGRASGVPNSDPALRKTMAQLAADAATRHPYKADAPRGGDAIARAEVEYFLKLINIVNLSEEDWTDVELWVNQDYVVLVPSMPKNVQRSINFQMLFDGKGNFFPTSKARVTKIELYRNGKMYNVPVHLAD